MSSGSGCRRGWGSSVMALVCMTQTPSCSIYTFPNVFPVDTQLLTLISIASQMYDKQPSPPLERKRPKVEIWPLPVMTRGGCGRATTPLSGNSRLCTSSVYLWFRNPEMKTLPFRHPRIAIASSMSKLNVAMRRRTVASSGSWVWVSIGTKCGRKSVVS